MQQAQLVKQFLQFLCSSFDENKGVENSAELPGFSELSESDIKSEIVHCKKQDFLFQQGDAVNSLWFVVYGMLRYVAVSEDGKEFTKHFVAAPGLAGSTRASTMGLPSQFAAQALSDCLLLKIDWQCFRQLISGNAVLARAYTGLLEHLFILKEQREYDFVLKSAEQRYLNFQSQFADVITDIPLQYIASYIGITPVALSRIRKRMA